MRFGGIRLGGIGPSLGAAASLVAAGVVIALVVAGLLGAPVWPGASDAQGDELTLPAPPVAKVAVPEPAGGADFAEVRSEATPARSTAADDRPRARTRRRGEPRRGAPRKAAPAPAAPDTASTPATSGSSESSAGGGGSSGGGNSGGGGGSTPTPAPTSTPAPAPAQPGAVQQTVAAVREVAEPVTDALPAPVATVVEQVLDTVEQTAATVDQTLKPVTDVTDALGLKRKP